MLWLGLDPPAGQHGRWIAERSAWQFDNGLLDEAAALLARYPQDLRAFSAVGYREAFDVLGGRLTLDDAIARVTLRTRQYARRQRTWFRAEPELVWLETGAVDILRLIDRIAALRGDASETVAQGGGSTPLP